MSCFGVFSCCFLFVVVCGELFVFLWVFLGGGIWCVVGFLLVLFCLFVVVVVVLFVGFSTIKCSLQ